MNDVGVNLIERTYENLNKLIGYDMDFEFWEIIKKCNLNYLDIGQNDSIYFYANKEIDLCLRFKEIFKDDVMTLQLTDIYHFPKFYKKSSEEINNDLICSYGMFLAIKKEAGSLLENGHSIDDNTFTDCLIDSYEKLKKG